jgi:UPF0755 protein
MYHARRVSEYEKKMPGIMKRYIALGVLLITVLVWWQPIPIGRTAVTIPEGASAKEIARYLSDRHVVRDSDEFLFWLRLTGKEKMLKSGMYELDTYKNPLYVISRLTRGGRSDIMVTVPEGLTISQIADILAVEGLVEREAFISLCHDPSFAHKLGIPAASLEGYLFPDTYSFSHHQNDSDVAATFISNFKRNCDEFSIHDPESLFNVITLASLVEKEARVDEERALIARVFINRLMKGRPLESCATILYALKALDFEKYRNKQQLLERDLKLDSPYNTYLHEGLPPGPICSPGKRSIEAVITPADVDYLYFVSMGNGKHHFSETYREHIAAKRKYSAKN